MRTLTLLLLCLSTGLFAQVNTELGSRETEPTISEKQEGTAVFVSGFSPTDVGFLHVYVDPAVDPLETYILRGQEMTAPALALLPEDFRNMEGTFYNSISIMGIEEDLYVTRYQGAPRSQIDMFAVRDGEVMHLKTLAYLDCDDTDCAQRDSYITDLNLDTTFDLVTITREDSSETEGTRETFTMPRATREWEETTELDVPWEGITFYKGDAKQ